MQGAKYVKGWSSICKDWCKIRWNDGFGRKQSGTTAIVLATNCPDDLTRAHQDCWGHQLTWWDNHDNLTTKHNDQLNAITKSMRIHIPGLPMPPCESAPPRRYSNHRKRWKKLTTRHNVQQNIIWLLRGRWKWTYRNYHDKKTVHRASPRLRGVVNHTAGVEITWRSRITGSFVSTIKELVKRHTPCSPPMTKCNRQSVWWKGSFIKKTERIQTWGGV